MSEYDIVRKGKLVLKGEAEKSKKRKHKKDKKEKRDEKSNISIDEDAIEHGGWWRCKKLSEITGSIAIEFQERQYVKSLDDGTFILGVKHEKGDPPAFDEELTAFIVNDSKIYIKSGFGKYLKVDTNNLIVGRSEAAGTQECFEPVWQGGKMAIQAANSCFLSIDPEDDQLVAIHKSISQNGDGVCVIRSNAFRGEIISKNAAIEEKCEDLDQIEKDYVKRFQKFQDKKIKISQEDKSELKKAQTSGKLHESLLDRRSKMKSDRYCK